MEGIIRNGITFILHFPFWFNIIVSYTWQLITISSSNQISSIIVCLDLYGFVYWYFDWLWFYDFIEIYIGFAFGGLGICYVFFGFCFHRLWSDLETWKIFLFFCESFRGGNAQLLLCSIIRYILDCINEAFLYMMMTQMFHVFRQRNIYNIRIFKVYFFIFIQFYIRIFGHCLTALKYFLETFV